MAAVEKRGVGVEVIGVPDFMSVDRMADKLLIHFLRPRNGGGEVQRLLYPTRLRGQALVIYEEPDVASRVLQKRHHELEIGDQRFPLEVKPVDRPELDLPVEATLNVSMIADETPLRRLLHLHGLDVIEWDRHTHRVRVKGSMMMLRSFKAETEKLLNAQTPNLTRPSSSSSSSSSSLGRSSPSPPGAVYKNSTHGSTAQAKQKPFRSIDAPAYASPSATPTSASTTTSSSLSPIGPVDSRHQPPRKPPVESFLAASDVVDYAQRYKKNGIADVLASHNVEMDVVAIDADVSSVVVKGRDACVAAEKLRSLLNDLNTTLHIRMVALDDLDHDAQVGVAKRVQELSHSYSSVLIRQMGGIIHLIGPRSSCDQLKERLLLERPVALPVALPLELPQVRTGRSQEKEPRRRSRSVPRNISGSSGRGELAGDAMAKLAPLSSVGGGYSSAKVGDEGGQGAALTREVRGQRGRSGSLTRISAKPEETANYGSTERTNLRPTTSPVVKASLMPHLSSKGLKTRFHRH